MSETDELHLRDAVDGDSEGVIRLIARVFAEYPGCVLDVDREEPELRAPASSFDRFWVLVRGAEVVGCGGLVRRGEEGVELKKLYLDPTVRGRGFARAIAGRVEDHARSVDARILFLWSDTRFAEAHGFYDRMGYRRTGRTRNLNDLSDTTEYHYEKRLDRWPGGALCPESQVPPQSRAAASRPAALLELAYP